MRYHKIVLGGKGDQSLFRQQPLRALGVVVGGAHSLAALLTTASVRTSDTHNNRRSQPAKWHVFSSHDATLLTTMNQQTAACFVHVHCPSRSRRSLVLGRRGVRRAGTAPRHVGAALQKCKSGRDRWQMATWPLWRTIRQSKCKILL